MAENELLGSFDSVEAQVKDTIDLTSMETIKDSLYDIAYSRAYAAGSKGDHSYLSTNNASVLQVLDDPLHKKDLKKRGYGPNPLKKYFTCVKSSKNGEGSWFRYNGDVWVDEANDLAEASVHAIIDGVYSAYLALAADGTLKKQTGDDDKLQTKMAKLINEYKNFKENTQPIKNTVAYVTNALKRSDDPFTESRYLIMKNGEALDTIESVVQKELVFVKTSPDMFIHERYQTTFNYIPNQQPGKALSHWLKTSPVDYATGVNLCRALICAVCSPKPKKFFSLIEMYGESNTGKSALLESVFKLSVPGLVAPATDAQFGKNPNNFAIGRIIGKRILMLTEYSSEFSESQVKSVTGGDTITADIKFKEPREFIFNGVLAITTNSKQGTELNISKSGLKERMFPVQFPRSVMGKEVVTPDGVTPAWDGPDLKYVALPQENDQNMSWMLDLWLEWEISEDPGIPLTDAQKGQVTERTEELDSISVKLLEGLQDNLWSTAQDGTPDYKLLKFSTFWGVYEPWIRKANTGETPKRNKILAEMRDRGMIIDASSGRFVKGYTDDSTWALRLEQADGRGLTEGM